ncbi:MAG: dihydrolipoamide acetyltransferase family protein, partial [Deltaproteobacteria bacterium]|nr:dihydrolipoamide acetyltransferase family protein [Deltaproteobacteria bacterium]
EGEVVKWKVKEGDIVEEHQVIMDVETDKAIVEVPSPKKGRVVKLNKAEGDIVKVGETLLKIEVEGAPEAAPPEEKKIEEERVRPPSVSVVGTLPEKEEVMASPKARSLARKLAIDLNKVTGTGPGGIVTEDDVKAVSAAPAPPPAAPPAPEVRPEEVKRGAKEDRYGPIETVPIKGVRRSITKNLLASQRSAAFVTGMDDADVTELWDLRARERKTARDRGIHLTFLPFFMKAAQHALAAHPMINGSVDEKGENIIIKKYYNMGFAVMTPDGLMVAVVKNVDKKTILEIAAELQDLSKKARDRKITLEELKGSAFTISNFGSFGGIYATPIINYPEIAILGTGKISERPWVKNGSIVARKILPLSLTFDHRVIDGAEAAMFLSKIVRYLEDPGRIFIESA